MELFESVFSPIEFGDFQELPLYQALYVSEELAFQELEQLTAPLSPRDSARCLRKALQDGSVELFRRILEHSAPGECAEMIQLPRPKAPGWGIRVRASLLSLAAMLDRPQQAARLLEHGYDVNGRGLAIANYLRSEGKFWSADAPEYVRFGGSGGCQLDITRPRMPDLEIPCVTPLAVALLCGSLETAALLLSRKEVWKGESSAVCRAAAMILDEATDPLWEEAEKQNQKEILRKIFFPAYDELPAKNDFLHNVYLQPAAFVDFCSTAILQHQLESGLCSPSDARQMLAFLRTDTWWYGGTFERTRAGKLLLLKKHFPQVCREGWAKAIFLQESVRRIREKIPHKTILTAWKQLSGKERDLTYMGNDIWMLSWRELQLLLQEAGENGNLVMDADALGCWFQSSQRCVGEVLKSVRIRRRDGEGISGLMQNLLLHGDLKLMKNAVKMGLLEQEDPKYLLEYLSKSYENRQDLRALVLTYAHGCTDSKAVLADWRDPTRWKNWGPWKELDEESAAPVVQELLYTEQTEDECQKTLFSLYFYMTRNVFSPDVSLEHPVYPWMVVDSLTALGCCAESGQALRLMMKYWPMGTNSHVRANWSDRFYFRGTPLTLAAALGREEQVRLLLDAGLHPDELGRGDCSRFFMKYPDYTEYSFSVTPFLAAILFGQEKIAGLLLERGATCDFSRPEYRNVLLYGSAESLALAEKLIDVGFEKIPQEELSAIRVMTAEHGERTCFWQGLRQKPLFQDLLGFD